MNKFFQPYDKVLVRMKDDRWGASFYGFFDTELKTHRLIDCAKISDDNIIPYEGNENLLGTANDVMADFAIPKIDMDRIIKRLKDYTKEGCKWPKLDMGNLSDGFHTFNELYEYRKLYNAAFFNLLPKGMAIKSKRHSDGEECFNGGWFIVQAELPTGQISNHYEMKDWDLFNIPECETANKWDGHSPEDVIVRLTEYLQGKEKIERSSPVFATTSENASALDFDFTEYMGIFDGLIECKGATLYKYIVPFNKFNPNDMEETRKEMYVVKNGKLARLRDGETN